MRRLLASLVLAVGLVASARAEDGIPRGTLASLKAATVFIKVDTPRGGATGSGFLMRVDGDGEMVLAQTTTRHVDFASTVASAPAPVGKVPQPTDGIDSFKAPLCLCWSDDGNPRETDRRRRG